MWKNWLKHFYRFAHIPFRRSKNIYYKQTFYIGKWSMIVKFNFTIGAGWTWINPSLHPIQIIRNRVPMSKGNCNKLGDKKDDQVETRSSFLCCFLGFKVTKSAWWNHSILGTSITKNTQVEDRVFWSDTSGFTCKV